MWLADADGGPWMGRKKAHTPEEIVAKLRQVEVLAAQGKAVAEAVRAIGVTEQTYIGGVRSSAD